MEFKFSSNVDFLIDVQEGLHINDVLYINGMPLLQVGQHRACPLTPLGTSVPDSRDAEESSSPGLVGSRVWCEAHKLCLPPLITVLTHEAVVSTSVPSHDIVKSVVIDLRSRKQIIDAIDLTILLGPPEWHLRQAGHC